MSVFNVAINTLFNDNNLAIDAIFKPCIGPINTVRVITHTPDIYQDVGLSTLAIPTFTLEVRVLDCGELNEGDEFVIDMVRYKVQGQPRADSRRLVWWVDVYRA